jgi:hypothetical protein
VGSMGEYFMANRSSTGSSSDLRSFYVLRNDLSCEGSQVQFVEKWTW